MRASRPQERVHALPLVLLGLCLSLPAQALQVRQEASRFDGIAIPDPSVVVSPAAVAEKAAGLPESFRTGWASFKQVHGKAWDVTIDARSGAPLLVQGQGIPLIPGSGNTLESATPPTLDSLAASLRSFVTANAFLAVGTDAELMLGRDGSGRLTPDLWKVAFDRVVAGVPVAGERYVFYVGHGNVIAFGASRWSPITTSALPYVPVETARSILFKYMGLGAADKLLIHEPGALTFVPLAAAGTENDVYEGSIGSGYETSLAWRFELEVEGEPGRWTGLVDAHDGRVLALHDTIQYALAKGGVFPLTDDAICPDGCEQANFPMPFADIRIGAATSTAGSMGAFTCAPGGSTATTTLSGQYVRVVDSCGAISQSVTCDADLNLGTSAGTDCVVPAGASAGDTHAARSSFYHLNRIKEHARAWLPSNTWLALQLRDNVNLNSFCNAYWSSGGASGTVNFYRSGNGCRNTGEIAGVFLHEWGHGLDQNDGGGYDNPSEAYADVASFFLTHKSCIGRGFRSTNCSGYGNACLSCTGVRDQDWDQHSTHAPQTPENWPSGCPNTGPYSFGPCGREVHCEAYLAGQTLWDLAVRDLPASGLDAQTSWQIADRLWFKSRLGSGGSAYTCGSPASNRSCAATSWYTGLRTVDDDDGNLANGTPHAAAIFAAFGRHNIPCGTAASASNQSTSSCPALPAPSLSTTAPAPNQIGLAWTAVAGASSYNVLRNDQGCDWGFTIVANVAGTSYTDTGLPNGFPLYYAIQPIGANSACAGILSTCTAAQASAVTSADLAVTKSGPGTAATGQSIPYTVSVTNAGPSVAASVELGDAVPAGTTFQSIDAAAGWSCSTPSVGGTGTISCTAASLAVGTPASFTIEVRVNQCAGNGTIVANTATVSSTTSDPSSANNSSSATTTLTDSGACDDGDACTTDACASGQCVGTPYVCDDQNGCTNDFCDPQSGCYYDPVNVSDGDECTIDSCDPETGAVFVPRVCDDANTCTTDSCDSAIGCVFAANTNACDDGDACTQTDACQAGICAGSSPIVCTASDACHLAGTCDPGTGACSNPVAPDGAPCDDADACTTPDACAGGQCVGTPYPCDDQNGCTQDYCDPLSGCYYYPVNVSDGNECTIDYCDPKTGSAAYLPRVCADGNGCTTDDCDTATGCVFTASTDPCDDGDPCTAGDACSAGLCAGAPGGPPAEVVNQRFSTATLQEWDGLTVVGPAAAYDVVRGALGEWPVGSGASEVCEGSQIAATSLDSPDTPAAESGFWYLVRGRNACGIGTYGSDSSGSPRVTSVCP